MISESYAKLSLKKIYDLGFKIHCLILRSSDISQSKLTLPPRGWEVGFGNYGKVDTIHMYKT